MTAEPTQTLELAVSKDSSIFVEVEPSQTGGPMEKVSYERDVKEKFEKVAATLAQLAFTLEEQLVPVSAGTGGFGLDEATLELGANLKGKADLFLVKGDAGAHMKITLKWKRDPSNSDF